MDDKKARPRFACPLVAVSVVFCTLSLGCPNPSASGAAGASLPSATEAAKLVANDGVKNDSFGLSVAMSGDGGVCAIGAPGNGEGQGAVYIYAKSAGKWKQTCKLTASDGAQDDKFASSLSMNSDGTVLLAGARSASNDGCSTGAAYVFSKDSGGIWSQGAKLVASDTSGLSQFGCSVALDGAGTVAVIGSYGNVSCMGNAYIFTQTSGAWTQSAKLAASDGSASDYFGECARISLDGTVVVIGADGDDDQGEDSGSAYIFSKHTMGWAQDAKLTASDGAADDSFGWSVAISGDGCTALIGAPFKDVKGSNSGAAYLFAKSGSIWCRSGEISPSDGAASEDFGSSVALSSDCARAVISIRDGQTFTDACTGGAYLFANSSGSWSLKEKLDASDGGAKNIFDARDCTAISSDGGVAVFGADGDNQNGYGSGSAYIFES